MLSDNKKTTEGANAKEWGWGSLELTIRLHRIHLVVSPESQDECVVNVVRMQRNGERMVFLPMELTYRQFSPLMETVVQFMHRSALLILL